MLSLVTFGVSPWNSLSICKGKYSLMEFGLLYFCFWIVCLLTFGGARCSTLTSRRCGEHWESPLSCSRLMMSFGDAKTISPIFNEMMQWYSWAGNRHVLWHVQTKGWFLAVSPLLRPSTVNDKEFDLQYIMQALDYGIPDVSVTDLRKSFFENMNNLTRA